MSKTYKEIYCSGQIVKINYLDMPNHFLTIFDRNERNTYYNPQCQM